MAVDKLHRRKLRFDSFEDALAEADRLFDADRQGKIARAGNWTLGQALGHLAAWADFAFEGYPPEIAAPFPIRFLARRFRKVVFNREMAAGVRIGKIPEGTVATKLVEPDEGLRRFHEAFGRLLTNVPVIPSPLFGRLTHDEWIKLNLRHAELHLGFFVPTSDEGIS